MKNPYYLKTWGKSCSARNGRRKKGRPWKGPWGPSIMKTFVKMVWPSFSATARVLSLSSSRHEEKHSSSSSSDVGGRDSAMEVENIPFVHLIAWKEKKNTHTGNNFLTESLFSLCLWLKFNEFLFYLSLAKQDENYFKFIPLLNFCQNVTAFLFCIGRDLGLTLMDWSEKF